MKKQTKTSEEEIKERQTKQKLTLIKSKNSAHGITLIALVITIIVLLILAAVSIATLTGENGILTQAETARDKTKEGELEERGKLIITNWNFEKDSGKTLEEYLNEHFDSVVNNENKTYTVTLEDYEMLVTDLNGKVTIKKKVNETDVYVTLYTDGTLAFSHDESTIEGKTVQESYGNIRGKSFNPGTRPWNGNITTVNFVNKVAPNDTAFWFYALKNLTEIENISNLLTDNVTSMMYMFQGCSELTSLDLSGFDTSNVNDMNTMFTNCSSLTKLDLSRFNTNKVTNMNNMFNGCISLISLDVSNFDTSNVTSMSSMFLACKNLESLDLRSFDTSKVTNMIGMFVDCTNMKVIYASKEKWVFPSGASLSIFMGCGVNYLTASDGSTLGI